uniref:Phage protein n=1 Tax=Ascaris lumbricoides TaxID=6252 RepID=A0A0M3HUC8_ASCLU
MSLMFFEYFSFAEEKLRHLRTPNHQPNPSEMLLSLKDYRERKLYELITGKDECFEDNFVDIPISASYLRRKIAPETVAINRQELVKLTSADMLESAIVDAAKAEDKIERILVKEQPKVKEKTD